MFLVHLHVEGETSVQQFVVERQLDLVPLLLAQADVNLEFLRVKRVQRFRPLRLRPLVKEAV